MMKSRKLVENMFRSLQEADHHTDPYVYALQQFQPWYTGQEDVKTSIGLQNVAVFEFPDESVLQRFLDDVGGQPHPLGGLRGILDMHSLERSEPSAESDTENEEKLSSEFRDELVPELESRGYEIDCPGSGGLYTFNRAGEEMPEDETGNMETLVTGQDDPANRDKNLAIVRHVAGERWEQDQDILTRLVDNLWNSQVPDSPEY